MPEQPRAVIVAEKQKDGRTKIKLVDPNSSRQVDDAHYGGDKEIRHLKEACEKNGIRVNVKEV